MKSPGLIARCAVLALLLAPQATQAGKRAPLYFFYSEGCVACVEEKAFLAGLAARVPELEVRAFESRYDAANGRKLAEAARLHGIEVAAVPATFVGAGEPIIGYRGDAVTGALIEKRVRRCVDLGCPDPLAALLDGGGGRTGPAAAIQAEAPVVDLPLLGPTDVSRLPVAVLAVVLGGLDGFNPCAFFVLFTLLGILAHARSRRRMLFVGGTFVACSGLVYFLFMAAWLNLFLHLGELRAITAGAGVVALLIGAINVKDYFFFKRGITLSIPESGKPRLFERMRALLRETSAPALVLGTVVLALAANAYELLCTAGFPMVFTRVLTLSRLTPAEHYLSIALYNLVYVLPLALVVVAFSHTLGARKLSERHGRLLKLVSGVMMLGLGVVVLTAPALFNSVLTGVALLAGALLGAALVDAATRSWKGRETQRPAPPAQKAAGPA